MGEKIKSSLTGKTYDLSKVARLINIQQICTYLKSSILPVDIYTSLDLKTNKPILVFLFDKEETKEIYERWKNSDNLWEELNDE